MVVKRQCSFCAAEIEPGTGSMYVKRDGTVFHFDSSSCRKQQLGLGRVGHRLKWTRAHALKRTADRSSAASRAASVAPVAEKPASRPRAPKVPSPATEPVGPPAPVPAATPPTEAPREQRSARHPPAKEKAEAPAGTAEEAPKRPKPRSRAKKPAAENPPADKP
jgi:large subunit ribosomal protein L24e